MTARTGIDEITKGPEHVGLWVCCCPPPQIFPTSASPLEKECMNPTGAACRKEISSGKDMEWVTYLSDIEAVLEPPRKLGIAKRGGVDRSRSLRRRNSIYFRGKERGKLLPSLAHRGGQRGWRSGGRWPAGRACLSGAQMQRTAPVAIQTE